MNFQRSGMVAMAAACVMAAAPSAKADNIIGSFTVAPQVWTGNTAQAVALTSRGSTSLNFNNPTAGPVTVIFTAECQIVGAANSFVDITVLIDNEAVVPSNVSDAYCSGLGVGVGGGLAHFALAVSKALAAGQHSVKVNTIAVGPHIGARLDDTTLIVRR